jgi:two-component system, chemotaxis family, protein-glutamate methylesterase/glutaminase
MKKIVVIGSSTGGPKALETIFRKLPESIPAPILVAQHLTKPFTAVLAQRLDKISPVKVSESHDKQLIEAGRAYVIPGDSHFFLCSPGPHIFLLKAKQFPIPSVNMGFVSVAEHYGPSTIGVILTGMGDDGVEGAKAVKQLGGKVLVQDEESSTVYSMPKAVQIAGFADEVLPLEKIAKRLSELVTKK